MRPRRVLDLYAGTGTITAFLARAAGQAVGIEVQASSVETAVRNAQRNGLDNLRMIRGDAARAATAFAPGSVDAMVVDPPRAGLSEEARRTILRLAPPALFYVSCNPATLGRDVRALGADGYRPSWIQPVDMFPQTFHVETIVELRREGA